MSGINHRLFHGINIILTSIERISREVRVVPKEKRPNDVRSKDEIFDLCTSERNNGGKRGEKERGKNNLGNHFPTVRFVKSTISQIGSTGR